MSFPGHAMKSEEPVKLLDVTLDNNLNFDTHVANLSIDVELGGTGGTCPQDLQ